MLAAQLGPRLRALGTSAAYVKWGLDVQEDALREGAGPRDPGFGEEPREAWGVLGTDDDARARRDRAGPLRRVLRADGAGDPPRSGGAAPPAADLAPPAAEVAPPVPLEAGIETLRVIEAARASSAERAVVPL